ncbi:hypothetical protein K0B96_15680 [Horticoccus luteus]|uniref:Uncharacterized protein n=1 Tax=Horticoccus luteus TaxID=2862869 RepID=A0A8F9TW95_9BACT|nr:hypothetical protein [Horticoccus luteus]QYM78722.1 hypothetical protein K0B96_15680 [Horticoccus luteus]
MNKSERQKMAIFPQKKIAAILGASVLILAAIDQTGLISCYSSQFASTTSNREAAKERSGDLIARVEIERPFWRWLPFVKVGNTLYRHSYQYPMDAKSILQRDSTTRTHLIVIGLCSTRVYDALADAPFDKVHREYSSR